MIHSTAIIDPSADIDESVEIGAYSVIEKNVSIKAGTIIKEHSIIRQNTSIGKNNIIYQFSTIGEEPQDLKFDGENTTCTIGDNNTFREYCSIHRGTEKGISDTFIGNNNLFMAYTHVAHDCIINDNCILSNAASLSWPCISRIICFIRGFSLVHQFCRVGEYAFSGLGTVITQDITPYTLVSGNHAKAYKINVEGLKRKGFDKNTIQSLEKCFKLFIKSKKTSDEKLDEYNSLNIENDFTKKFVTFFVESKRGVTR